MPRTVRPGPARHDQRGCRVAEPRARRMLERHGSEQEVRLNAQHHAREPRRNVRCAISSCANRARTRRVDRERPRALGTQAVRDRGGVRQDPVRDDRRRQHQVHVGRVDPASASARLAAYASASAARVESSATWRTFAPRNGSVASFARSRSRIAAATGSSAMGISLNVRSPRSPRSRKLCGHASLVRIASGSQVPMPTIDTFMRVPSWKAWTCVAGPRLGRRRALARSRSPARRGALGPRRRAESR